MRPPPTIMALRTLRLKMSSFLKRRLIFWGEPTTSTESPAWKWKPACGMNASPSRTTAATSVPLPKERW